MINKPPVVILGASGHAMVIADIFRENDQYEVVGFLDDLHPERKGEFFSGSTILGGDEQLDALLAGGVRHVIVGFGNCRARLNCAENALRKGFSLATAIHPSAVIARDVVIGPGTVIAAGSVLNPMVRIGQNVIINTSASVDHECQIADGAHIGPGVHLGGGVHVGNAVEIAIGSTVIRQINIGDYACVGAGSVVVKDVPSED